MEKKEKQRERSQKIQRDIKKRRRCENIQDDKFQKRFADVIFGKFWPAQKIFAMKNLQNFETKKTKSQNP